MKRLAMPVAALTLLLPLLVTGCPDPCKDKLEQLSSRVNSFLKDRDPLTAGNQPCVTATGPNYEEICDLAEKAMSTRWPFFDCTLCDSLEIQLCGCYGDNVWVMDTNKKPLYPAVVYCLANYYRVRSLGVCDPSFKGDPKNCYDASGVRQEAKPKKPVIQYPTLLQLNTCDAETKDFACANHDCDNDGIPDAYDGTGNDRMYECLFNPPDCLSLPTSADWDEWFHNPKSLYDGGKFYVDAQSAPQDTDKDGVSNTCDNCPNTPNGFDCLKIIQDFDQVAICDANQDGTITVKDIESLDITTQNACLDLLNQHSHFIIQCDVNQDGVVTLDELKVGDQLDTDGDGLGDACDSCPTDPLNKC